ncbi:neuraminidase-like domain-containing protein [Streptomyces tunisiensis]|uniref:Tc toxin subunit A-related protein n=1 Tax=Streptomyces tunisiensis TaxID=948699 RepID=UPI003EE1036D
MNEPEAERIEEVLERHDLAALLHVDFHDPAHRAGFLRTTSAADADVDLLKAAQRLARIGLVTDPVARATAHLPQRAVARLTARGLTSAHHISELPESVFASEHADAFGGDEGLAREAHRRAVQVRAAVRHAAANVRDIASPYFRSIHGNAVDATLTDYVESIPGYQELFGSLNYVACDECGSIFGPAAFLFDLLRISERYITQESPGIPPDHTLRERRPDLFELPLTCDNTNVPVPNVLLVNDVIKRRLGQGRVRELATAAYPFNVPFNEPRTQLAGALARLGTPLVAGAAALLAPDPERLVLDSLPLAAAALGLSPETVRFITTPRTTEADIAAEYGLSGLTGHLPVAGPGSITVRAGEKRASGADGRLGEFLAVGQQFGLTIAGRSQLRTVTRTIDQATVEVDVAWSDSATNSPWTRYPPQDLTTVQMFRDRAGIATYDDVVALFEQRLSPEEQATIGGSLWINATGESLPDLRVSVDTGGDEANPIWRIRGLSVKRLDRLSRLLRLSRAVGVPVDVLDWLVIQEAPAPADAEITTALLIRLATLRRLADAIRLPLVDVAAFAYRLKTIGRESASTLADPFDRIFNAASLRRGADPYTAPSPIPFDPARPLAWPVGASSDWSANEGRVVTASATTVTLAHDAASDNGAYVGLTVAVTSGPGKGQRAVVQSYDGPSRLATLYTAWPTVPDTSSTYAVTALPGVADRLAAALRLRVVDLHLLGAHVGGRPYAIVLLTLENLTALWRLATLASWTRLPTEAFLTLARVLKLPAVPPTPRDGLDQAERIIQVSAWLARTKFTVYELDYVLTGTRSRYLRLNHQPTALPAEVAAIARNGSNTLLTAETLVQAGFTPEDANGIRARLQEKGFVDRRGTVLPARERFAAAAARFPVGTSSFAQGPIVLAQAQAAVAELREQHPPYLTALDADSSVLTWNYTPGTDLAGLFTGLAGTDGKRAIVAEALAATAQRVTCTELACLVPVSAGEFVTEDIGPAQSQAVYDALLALRPPVLEPATVPGEALLSADYSAQTPPGLFLSPATGQRATITSYGGADRVATVDGTWTVVPDAFTTYEVRQTATGEVLTRGSARGGTDNSITLAQSALPDDNAYDGCVVVLVADTDAEVDRKVSQVRAALTSTAARIAAVRDVLAQARAAQTGYAAQALAALLAVPPARLGLLLPLATGQFTLDDYLPGLLTTPTDGTVPADVLALVDCLTRAGLAAGRTGLDDDALAGVARRPDHFGLAELGAFTLGSLRLLSAVPTFVGQVGTQTSSLISYLDLWTSVVGDDGKRRALSTMAGWEPQQVEITGRFLESAQLGWAGIDAFPGLLRLKVPLAAVDALAADADFLVRVAQAAMLPSLDGGAGDEAIWEEYLTTAAAALALLPARFGEEAAPTVADTLTRELAAATRDVLLGYAVVVLSRTLPGVRTVADLFDYLLIDLEMSGCDTTSPIAQGITSVQLYMQRVRLGLETGASAASIRDTWWEWISTYRLWEANRRVFLYPENYLDPSLRKDASPEFGTLVDELLQGRPTDEHVTRVVANYFDAFENLAGLTHVSAYKMEDDVREGGQIDQQSHLVARTNTTPYTYYVRTFTRSLLPDTKETNPASGESIVWGPWQKVEATIDSPDATPVVAFNRLFLFWNEIEPTKSSRVSTSEQGGASTKTESSWTATLHYTYQRSTGTWISPQHLQKPMAIRAMPNEYPPMTDALVARAYEDIQAYWSHPYAQRIAQGLPAAGTLSFSKDSNVAQGYGTALQRQVDVGDSIWVGGETRRVMSVLSPFEQLEVDRPFRVERQRAPFKVIPHDQHLTRFPPFGGPGKPAIRAGFPDVLGGADTRFERDFTVGDQIRVGEEVRTVVAISRDSLVVDQNWSISSEIQPQKGQIVEIKEGSSRVTGVDGTTHFMAQRRIGDAIMAEGQRRIVVKIYSDSDLLVDRPFSVPGGVKTVPYAISVGLRYTAIPCTRGDERLMVLYGPNLDVSAQLPPPSDDWRLANDGDDPFIASLNQINAKLYDALTVANAAKKTFGSGDVAGQPTLLLDQALNQQTVRLFAPSVPTTNTATPVRVALDRENGVLFVRGEDRPLLALYWGNSVSGATQNQTVIRKAGDGDRPLAYNVGGNGSSLYGYGNQIGWYLFNAAGESFWIASDDIKARTVASSTFLQPSDNYGMLVQFGPHTTSDAPLDSAQYRFSRLTTSVVPALKARLLAGGFDSLLSLDAQSLPEPPFCQFYQVPSGTPPPAVDTDHLPSALMDFNGAYGLYFWEVFFHVPLLVAQQLTSNQSFAEAKRWCEYIYNPQAQFANGHDGERRYWRFRPIREGMTLPGLRDILQNQFEVTTYNDDPFDPDAIARLRISAYAKAAVLKYVDNLIAWGDALFRQDTRESVAEATNLYLLASQLLGHRPETVGALPPRPPQSFNEIAKNYTDDIPQFLLELENSSLVPVSGEGHRYADAPINDINAYFCVPENAELTARWDRVEDRLYKIRHCLTIDGVERSPALFAPPIDIRNLVASHGTAGEVGGVSVLAAGPIPAFRFSQLISSARRLTEDVIRLGSSLLSALENKDVQALASLQTTQEGRVLNLISAIRQQQLDLVSQERAAIQAGRDSAAYRSAYYQDLINAGYNAAEIAQIAYLMTGMVSQGASTVVKTASAVSFALPQVGSPFAMTYGGQQVGHTLQESSAALDSFAQFMVIGSEALGLSGQYARRSEDWELQKRLADFDVSQFDARLVANASEQTIAQKELSLARTQAEQQATVCDFYRTRFTDEALYGWMANRLSTTYFQTYSLALDLARMAQRALQYELGTETTFVNAGTWDDLRRGLTAGESLMLSIDQLESAYLTGTRRTFEITKAISLASIDPVAFLHFIRTGEATFSFDEALFDADYPGHFRRRIKTLSVSIPALVGPYQNVRATLTQTANRVLLQPDRKAVQALLGEDVEVDANKIEHNVRAQQSITVSLGQGDSGLFQVDFNDPLLLPFEQTGAVSNWQLSMPPATNPIDLSSIADVIFELKYTALDGGSAFRSKVADLPQLRRRKWSSTTQAARQEASAWHLFMTGPVEQDRQTLSLRLAGLALPNVTQPQMTGFFLRLVVPDGTTTTSRHPYLALSLGEAEPFAFSPDARGSALVAFDAPLPLGSDPLRLGLAFNLTPGCTPAALLDDMRLSATVLKDIELVLFLAGDI